MERQRARLRQQDALMGVGLPAEIENKTDIGSKWVSFCCLLKFGKESVWIHFENENLGGTSFLITRSDVLFPF